MPWQCLLRVFCWVGVLAQLESYLDCWKALCWRALSPLAPSVRGDGMAASTKRSHDVASSAHQGRVAQLEERNPKPKRELFARHAARRDRVCEGDKGSTTGSERRQAWRGCRGIGILSVEASVSGVDSVSLVDGHDHLC